MALNTVIVSKHAQITMCYWGSASGTELGSNGIFILPKLSEFSDTGCYHTLLQLFLSRKLAVTGMLNHKHIILDQKYFASIYPKRTQGMETSKTEIMLCFFDIQVWIVLERLLAQPPNTKYL